MADYNYLAQLNDEALQQMASEGDARAEEELIERYTRVVRICARPYFLAGGDSEDLTQEGLMGLLGAVRSYKPESGFCEKCREFGGFFRKFLNFT